VRSSESHYSKSMLHAFVTFATEEGYSAATHPSMRIFGLNLRHHNCRTQPAHARAALFLDAETVLSATAAPDMSEETRVAHLLQGSSALKGALNQLLESQFRLEQLWQSSSSSGVSGGVAGVAEAAVLEEIPSVCRLDFASHSAARAAEALLAEKG
jgi:hypothetical protein